MDFELFRQLFVNGVINGSWYGALGLGFALILGVSGRFHLAYGLTYTLTAYVAIAFAEDVGMPLIPAILLALVVGAIAGMLIEGLIYRPLAAGGGGLLAIFIAALGLGILTENLIRLTWGAESASRVLSGFPIDVISIGDVNFTTLDLASVLTAWFLVVTVALFLKYAPQGRLINAVRVNPEMAQVVGIDPNKIYLLVFGLGSLLGGVFAVYAAMKYAAVPDMGLQPTFIAFIVAFISTSNNPLVIAGVGLFIGLVESLSGLWLSAQWSPLVVFTVLFVYLTLRPLRLPTPARLVRLLAAG